MHFTQIISNQVYQTLKKTPQTIQYYEIKCIAEYTYFDETSTWEEKQNLGKFKLVILKEKLQMSIRFIYSTIILTQIFIIYNIKTLNIVIWAKQGSSNRTCSFFGGTFILEIWQPETLLKSIIQGTLLLKSH